MPTSGSGSAPTATYGEGNANICGDIRHGIGKECEPHSNAKQCPGYQVTEGNKTLPPVSSFMPSNIATSNSNYRLVQVHENETDSGTDGLRTRHLQRQQKHDHALEPEHCAL